MKIPSKSVVALATLLLFITSTTAHGEITDISISADSYLYQPVPQGMFMASETLVGFEDGSTQYYGQTTVKGPDNVWTTVFDPCSEKVTNYCIESVSYKKSGGESWIGGSLSNWKPAPEDPVLSSISYTQASEIQYKEYFINPETGLPRGGYARVWNLPGASHGGGDGYLVGASVYYYKNVNPDLLTQTFGIGIAPVKLGASQIDTRSRWPFSYGTRYNFPNDLQLQVKVRMGKFASEVGSWFSGRIQDPSLRIDNSIITLSGSPTQVLAAHTGPISCENRVLTTTMREACTNKDPKFGSAASVGTQRFNVSIENSTNPSPLYPNGMFAYYEPLLKPVGYTSEWNGATWGVKGSGSCQIAPGKIAIVTSNATLYSTYPPAWDEKEQTLAYRVGSLHLDHKGELHRGHFNLAVPRDFAECLWGKNMSSAKAAVSITNADGTNNVATTVVSQDDQMIYFKVAGFTFSTPEIKVKLIPVEAVPTPTPSPTPSPTKKPVVKNLTITCIKGKAVKKVTAVNPKCPEGYKKK